MYSDDSSRGSSASNTSSNISGVSHQSSSMPHAEIAEEKSPAGQSVTSLESSVGNRSKLRSMSSNEISPRSPIKSDSDSLSSSSSSDAEIEDAKSTNSALQDKSKISSDRSSCSSAVTQSKCILLDSTALIQSLKDTKNSNSSFNRSRSSSSDNICTDRTINIAHEDLSDVSDNESEKLSLKQSIAYEGMIVEASQDNNLDIIPNNNDGNKEIATEEKHTYKTDIELKSTEINKRHSTNKSGTLNGNESSTVEILKDLVKSHDEDALDFEAEEGECQDVCKEEENSFSVKINDNNGKLNNCSDNLDGEELEEGEVSDEDEKRPEETEPKPVCRFYTRGQCTWGMSCRFLHPGVTDKGNYTMFDLVRPVPVPQASANTSRTSNFSHGTEYIDYRTERPTVLARNTVHHATTVYPALHENRVLPTEGSVVVESAWERGLRTAKEMMRKANKRKEQDMDFEDKKMNLTLSPDELEKEPFFLKERVSPPDPLQVLSSPYVRHGVFQETPSGLYSPAERYGRGPTLATFDDIDPYGRTSRYRELPPHRMPQYEDERRVRPTREVIVQRVEPESRSDEWNDPWMRSKSPVGHGSPRERSDKRRRGRRSYSTNSSYSSSSSSRSDSSSDSTRTSSPTDRKRRYSNLNKPSPSARRHPVCSAASPSLPKRHTRQSQDNRSSPNVKRTTVLSPTHKRKILSPVKKKSTSDKSKLKQRHATSSSESGSSDTSASDSDSDSASSTTGSSTRSKKPLSFKRARGPEKDFIDRKVLKKAETAQKRSPISIEIKKHAIVGASALTSPTNSNNSEKDSKKSRRDELLKQLRAVEDAIAKKRSKLST